jgi:hypothetical protein
VKPPCTTVNRDLRSEANASKTEANASTNVAQTATNVEISQKDILNAAKEIRLPYMHRL